MPPDFNKLPKPGQMVLESTKDIDDQSKIRDLLKKNNKEEIISSTDEPTTLELLILEEIK